MDVHSERGTKGSSDRCDSEWQIVCELCGLSSFDVRQAEFKINSTERGIGGAVDCKLTSAPFANGTNEDGLMVG